MKQPKQRAKEIELTEIVRMVYNKIAEWNNEDADSGLKGERLKFVSHEIVDYVLTSAFEQLEGAKTKIQVVPSEEVAREKINIKDLTPKEKKGYSGLFSSFIKNKKNKK